MKSNLTFTVCIVVLLGSCSASQKSNMSAIDVPLNQQVDGAYRFVSETTILEKPDKSKQISSEWAGLWIFHSGYFSRTAMKKNRPWTQSALSDESIGYESSAGTYKIESNSLLLTPEVSLYPFPTEFQRLEFKLKFDGTKLTLTRTILPYMENLSKGKQTIVLERVL